MKMKITLGIIFSFISCLGFAQYIGLKAKWIDTRTVDNLPLPPSREDRLVLSFYTVSYDGTYTPVQLSNYWIWIEKEGSQYGSPCGGLQDSCGNNYPGYSTTAPQVVAYFNSYASNDIDCNPALTTPYIVNGQELDCGFIQVSHWEEDPVTLANTEIFPAPNVCLHYYQPFEPYFVLPGNVNFSQPVNLTTPYNWYSFSCGNSGQQLIVRGVVPQGTDTSLNILPVEFANEKASYDATQNKVTISWSFLNESNVQYYEIERSTGNNSFAPIGRMLPILNNGSQADYQFSDTSLSNAGHSLQYRIKALLTNGTYLYSIVLQISIPRPSISIPISIYPNPVVNNQFIFQCPDLPAGYYHIAMINGRGAEVLQKEIYHSGGSLAESVYLQNLASGTYCFMIQSENIKISKKIILKN